MRQRPRRKPRLSPTRLPTISYARSLQLLRRIYTQARITNSYIDIARSLSPDASERSQRELLGQRVRGAHAASWPVWRILCDLAGLSIEETVVAWAQYTCPLPALMAPAPDRARPRSPLPSSARDWPRAARARCGGPARTPPDPGCPRDRPRSGAGRGAPRPWPGAPSR